MKLKVTIVILLIISVFLIRSYNLSSIDTALENESANIMQLVSASLESRIIDGQEDVIYIYSRMESLRSLYLVPVHKEENVEEKSFFESVLLVYSRKLMELALNDYNAEVEKETKEIMQNSYHVVQWYLNDYDIETVDMLERIELESELEKDGLGWKVKENY